MIKEVKGMKNIFKIIFVLTAALITLGLADPVEAYCTGTVTISSPINGDIWSGTQNIVWDYSGLTCAVNDKLDITLYQGGSVHKPAGFILKPVWNSSPASFDTTGGAYGLTFINGDNYQIQIESPGDGVFFRTNMFEIDNTKPVISNTDSSADWYRVGHNVWVSFNATDTNLDLTSFAVTINGQPMAPGSGCGGTGAYCYTRTLDGTELPEGPAQVSITVSDLATPANTVTDLTETINVDFTAPTTPVITTPSDFVNQPTIVITSTASTDLPSYPTFDTYQVRDRHTSTALNAWGAGTWANTSEDHTGFTFALDQDADNDLCIRAIDLAGNIGGFDCVTITEDSTDPADITPTAVDKIGTPGTITVSWTDDPTSYSSINFPASNVVQYEIFVSEDSFTDVSTMTAEHTFGPGVQTVDVTTRDNGHAILEGTTYYIAVVATDDADNRDENVTGVVVTQMSAEDTTVALADDWNLISSPLILVDTNIVNVLSGVASNVDIVWYYDETAGWISYIPGTGGLLTTFEDGNGYFVKMENPDTLTFSGFYYALTGDTFGAPAAYHRGTGWQLMGYSLTSDTASMISSDYFDKSGFSDITNIHDFNAGTQKYETVADGDTLVAGDGYWGYVSAFCGADTSCVYGA